ncbi:Putative SOS response-associated peptidase YedK [Roseomonas rosea]|uniref:Abasic site processing protein n=1 Tax=Muricoccus roseus TaxID=198092 RepID=A0A1M6EAF5_9PROT|nr:SOS response-associated peptidase [Roseomonas rosea]SHI82452.1 Putative SOS response-associated peptidase YedK [Roseomonas rosea]
MCGRYFLQRDATSLGRYFEVPEASPMPNFAPSWNMAPTQDGVVLRRNPESGARQLGLLRWGLVPHWAKDAKDGARLINARADGVAEKPSFRDAFARRRCIVPADGFYEWLSPKEAKPRDPKQPFAVALASGEPMGFAGLWEGWKDPEGNWLRTYSIITTEANPKQAPLHHRMPVILPRQTWAAWLGEEEAGPEDLQDLLRPCPPEWLACWPVEKRVNKVSENGAALILPDRSVVAPAGLDDPSPYSV